MALVSFLGCSWNAVVRTYQRWSKEERSSPIQQESYCSSNNGRGGRADSWQPECTMRRKRKQCEVHWAPFSAGNLWILYPRGYYFDMFYLPKHCWKPSTRGNGGLFQQDNVFWHTDKNSTNRVWEIRRWVQGVDSPTNSIDLNSIDVLAEKTSLNLRRRHLSTTYMT